MIQFLFSHTYPLLTIIPCYVVCCLPVIAFIYAQALLLYAFLNTIDLKGLLSFPAFFMIIINLIVTAICHFVIINLKSILDSIIESEKSWIAIALIYVFVSVLFLSVYQALKDVKKKMPNQ